MVSLILNCWNSRKYTYTIHQRRLMSTLSSVTVKSVLLSFPFFFLHPKHFRGRVEGTSTKEDLLMREIEDLPVVTSLSTRSGGINQDTTPTWGVPLSPHMETVRMQDVLWSRWGPSVCPPNILQCSTVCVSFWHESNRITTGTVSLQYKHAKLPHQMSSRQNVLWLTDLPRVTQMTYCCSELN